MSVDLQDSLNSLAPVDNMFTNTHFLYSKICETIFKVHWHLTIKRYAKKVNNKNVIFLTFDDGPHPKYTRDILDLLKCYNAKASFFVIGSQLSKFPILAKQIVKEGHLLGNNSYTYASGNKLTPKEVVETQNIINSFQNEELRYFRPPRGLLTAKIHLFLLINKFHLIFWTNDSKDSHGQPKDHIISQLKGLKTGSIVLFHDDGELCI